MGGGLGGWHGRAGEGGSPGGRGKPPTAAGAEGTKPGGNDVAGTAQSARSDSAQTVQAPR